jgi:hypothetical protein
MLAWGTGQAWWDTNRAENYTFQTSGALQNKVQLPYTNVSGVLVTTTNYDGTGVGTTYTAGTDYTVDLNTGTVTRVVAGSIPNGGAVKVSYKANRPAEDVTRHALFAEVGRHKLTSSQFVTPDANGTIIVTNGKFSPSVAPTNYLYLQFVFDFTDGSGFTIRELAVFMDTVVDPALPPGQLYYVPSNILDPGILLLLQNQAPLERAVATRQTIAVVVDF